MIARVKTNDDYHNICGGKEMTIEGTKQARHWFKKQCENFTLVDILLFWKKCRWKPQTVFVEDMIASMKLEVQTLHRRNYYGHNRLYGLYKQLYFSISRSLVWEVCAKYNIWAQAQPLKTKEKFKHILAGRPFERLIIVLLIWEIMLVKMIDMLRS